jgi:hypothetical protein
LPLLLELYLADVHKPEGPLSGNSTTGATVSSWPIPAGRLHWQVVPAPLVMMLVRTDDGNGQLVADSGQFDSGPLLVSLATLAKCSDDYGQIGCHFAASTFRGSLGRE